MRKEFNHLMIDDMTWGLLTHEQRMRKLLPFLSRGMDEKEDSIHSESASGTETLSKTSQSVTTAESEIITIPTAILKWMFKKAEHLLRIQGNIVPNVVHLTVHSW